MKQRATLIVCAVDLAMWAVIFVALFFTSSDLATSGLDVAAAIVVTILFALTALPAFLLARAQRESTLALVFALAFPVSFLLLFLFVTTLMM